MLNCIKLKVWWEIKDLIEQFMKQESTCKKGSTSGTEVGEIRDQIKENWKFDGHLGVHLKKSEMKDILVKDAQI